MKQFKKINILYILIVATVCWSIQYYVYYSAQLQIQKNIAKENATVSELIISSIPGRLNQEEILRNLFIHSKAEIRITDNLNNLIIYQRPSLRDSVYAKDIKFCSDFTVNDKTYTFFYQYSNRSKYFIALWRAVTLSLTDFIWYDITYAKYIENLVGRSFWFYIPLISILLIFLLYSYQEKKSLEQSIATTNKMLLEFKNRAIDDPKQQLQTIEVDWFNLLKNAINDEIHTLKNITQISDISLLTQDEKDCIYNEIIQPVVNTILEHLNKLPDTLSVEKQYIPIDIIIDSLKQQVFNKTTVEVQFDYLPEELVDKTCFINIHRIVSMILNIIANANQAMAKQYTTLRSKIPQIRYVRQLTAKIFIMTARKKEWLGISIQDNGGGIPRSILDSIYKSPILSSKVTSEGKFRNGEGTSYVAYFAQYMECTIKVKNIDQGAEITILIPITTNGGKNDKNSNC